MSLTNDTSNSLIHPPPTSSPQSNSSQHSQSNNKKNAKPLSSSLITSGNVGKRRKDKLKPSTSDRTKNDRFSIALRNCRQIGFDKGVVTVLCSFHPNETVGGCKTFVFAKNKEEKKKMEEKEFVKNFISDFKAYCLQKQAQRNMDINGSQGVENDEGSTATTGLPNQSDDIDGQTPEVVTVADLRNQHIMDAIDRVARGPPSSSSVHSEDDAMEEGAEELLTEAHEDPEANVIQTRSPSFSSFSDSEDVISPTKEGEKDVQGNPVIPVQPRPSLQPPIKSTSDVSKKMGSFMPLMRPLAVQAIPNFRNSSLHRPGVTKDLTISQQNEDTLSNSVIPVQPQAFLEPSIRSTVDVTKITHIVRPRTPPFAVQPIPNSSFHRPCVTEHSTVSQRNKAGEKEDNPAHPQDSLAENIMPRTGVTPPGPVNVRTGTNFSKTSLELPKQAAEQFAKGGRNEGPVNAENSGTTVNLNPKLIIIPKRHPAIPSSNSELAPKTNLKGDASNNQNHLRPRTPLLENAQSKKGHQISGTTVNVGTVIPKLIIIQKGHSAHPSSNSELAPTTNLIGEASNNQNYLRPRTPLLENVQPKTFPKRPQNSGSTVNGGRAHPKFITTQKGPPTHLSSNSELAAMKNLKDNGSNNQNNFRPRSPLLDDQPVAKIPKKSLQGSRGTEMLAKGHRNEDLQASSDSTTTSTSGSTTTSTSGTSITANPTVKLCTRRFQLKNNETGSLSELITVENVPESWSKNEVVKFYLEQKKVVHNKQF